MINIFNIIDYLICNITLTDIILLLTFGAICWYSLETKKLVLISGYTTLRSHYSDEEKHYSEAGEWVTIGENKETFDIKVSEYKKKKRDMGKRIEQLLD